MRENEVYDVILLIGTNPLPNYVVAKSLEHKICHLFLIYAERTRAQEGTKDYAENIANLLPHSPCEFIAIPDVGNPAIIQRTIRGLKNKLCAHHRIHLNYTGGTKTLAVHTYSTLKTIKPEKLKATYLDARTYTIIDDTGNICSSTDLREDVILTIDELLKLHRYSRDEKLQSWEDFTFKEPLTFIKHEIIQREGRLRKFLKWVDDLFRPIFKIVKDNGSVKKYLSRLDEKNPKADGMKSYFETFNERTPDFIIDFLKTFSGESSILDESGILWRPNKDCSSRDLKRRLLNTVRFIDGIWLEWYVYSELRDLLQNKGLEETKQFGHSLTASRGNEKFELDVFILRGYQLNGISVTTAPQRHLCKLKGFEIIHRVRQIGGDESRAFLITRLNRDVADSLQRDLLYSTGAREDKFLVFGKDDLPNIGESLYEEVFR